MRKLKKLKQYYLIGFDYDGYSEIISESNSLEETKESYELWVNHKDYIDTDLKIFEKLEN